MIRIAFVSNSASGEYTGRVRWWQGLMSKGYEVTYILPESEEEFIKMIEASGIRVIGWNLLRDRRNIVNKFMAIYKLARILKREKFTITHSFAHESNIYTSIAAWLIGQKHVVNTVTGLGSAFIEPTFFGKLIERLYMLLDKRVQIYSFENEEDYLFFSFVPEEKKRLIYGAGVDLSYYSMEKIKEEDLDEVRTSLGIEQSDLVVVYIGRLLKYKGINDLIEAWKTLSLDNAYLLMVGEIDEESPSSFTREDILEYGKIENVKFLGRREDIREILAISDIFVNPSSYREGIPRTNMEAMSMEKPIITTNNVGCRYTVEDGKNGILVDVNDIVALASAIETIASSRDLREQMGRASRRIALEKFSLDYVVKEYAEIYRNILL